MTYLKRNEYDVAMQLASNTYVLAELVIKANEGYGYEQTFLIGQQGTGKTTYACHVAYQVLAYFFIKLNGERMFKEYAQREIWEDCDTILQFSPERRLTDNKPSFYDQFDKALETGNKIKYTIFDDAGLHFSKYIWSYGDKKARMKVAMVNGIFNLIREGCSGTTFTSPDDDIFVELRKKSWISGEPTQPEGTGWEYIERTVTLYRKKIKPWDMKTYSKGLGSDSCTLWLPETFRERYLKRKRAEARATLNELRKLSDEISEDAEKRNLSNEITKLVNHREVIDITVLDANRFNKIRVAELSATIGKSGGSVTRIRSKHNAYVESLGACPDCTAIGGAYHSKTVETKQGTDKEEFTGGDLDTE